jgi:hypothetical protein
MAFGAGTFGPYPLASRRLCSNPAGGPTSKPLTFRFNLHSAPLLPAVSFPGGFQTPAGPGKTRAHPSGRHLKPITVTDISW